MMNPEYRSCINRGHSCTMSAGVLDSTTRLRSSHRAILAARSKHFQALFQSGMKDASAEEVAMEGVSAEVFSRYLFWVYNGRGQGAAWGLDGLHELMQFADQLNEVPLIHLCESEIASAITVRIPF